MTFPASGTHLAAGRRLELETLHGTAVRLGRQGGIPTPLNFTISAALQPNLAGLPALRPAPVRRDDCPTAQFSGGCARGRGLPPGAPLLLTSRMAAQR
ncbi:MAG: hypothetical protein NVSMB65_02940 [Chloroflexota bacterium]